MGGGGGVLSPFLSIGDNITTPPYLFSGCHNHDFFLVVFVLFKAFFHILNGDYPTEKRIEQTNGPTTKRFQAYQPIYVWNCVIRAKTRTREESWIHCIVYQIRDEDLFWIGYLSFSSDWILGKCRDWGTKTLGFGPRGTTMRLHPPVWLKKVVTMWGSRAV